MSELETIIKEVIRKDCRADALKIMTLTTNEIREEFFSYYEKGSFNICCMVIDKAKSLLPEIDSDCFGEPWG